MKDLIQLILKQTQLDLTSKKEKFPLVCKGDCEDWNNCQGDFHVRIEVSFEPSKLKKIKVITLTFL